MINLSNYEKHTLLQRVRRKIDQGIAPGIQDAVLMHDLLINVLMPNGAEACKDCDGTGRIFAGMTEPKELWHDCLCCHGKGWRTDGQK